MISSMKDLKSGEQKWLTKAVVGIILADGIIEKDQVTFIKKLSSVFLEEESKETLLEISGLLRVKEFPQLEGIKVDNIEHLIYMLDVLSAAVFANGKKLNEETAKYFEAGQKMGINIGTLSYRISLEAEKFRVKRKLVEIRENMRGDYLFSLAPQH
jgi:hypothetical protein